MNGKEIDYNELFGIEAEGEKEQEPAEPAQDQNDQTEEEAPEAGSAEEQEASEPEEPQDEANEETTDEETQNPEENAKYAAARRKAEAERDAAIAEAKNKAEAEIKAFYENCGLVDPYTQKPITTKEEYDAYKSRFEEEKRKNFQKKSGMSDEEYQAFVNGLPEVIAAKEEREKAEQAEAKARVEQQIKEIGELDPTVTKIEDLTKLPTYPKLYELVKAGYTLVDAYKVANFDTLTQGAAEGARQAALNAARGKQHLSVTKQRGTGAPKVPEEVMSQYRFFNPDASDEEIRAHYARSVKQ